MRNLLSNTPHRGAGASTRRGPVARLRARRRPVRALATGIATLGMAVAVHAARPAPVEAADLYSTCTELVGEAYKNCDESADGMVERALCAWGAGVGYLGCAVIGAVEKFGPIVIPRLM